MEVSYMSVDLRGVFVPCTSPFDSTTGELDVIGLETNLDSYLVLLVMPDMEKRANLQTRFV